MEAESTVSNASIGSAWERGGAPSPRAQRRGCPRGMRTPSPRIKRAIELYSTAAAPTMRAAGKAVGLHPLTLSFMLRNHKPSAEYAKSLSSSVRERTVDLSAVIKRLSEKALVVHEDLMSTARDEVRFQAARDILDRNPETSKMNRVAVESLTITDKDVKSLAAALVAGAGLKSQFAQAASGDFVPGLAAVDPFAGKSREAEAELRSSNPASDDSASSSTASRSFQRLTTGDTEVERNGRE